MVGQNSNENRKTQSRKRQNALFHRRIHEEKTEILGETIEDMDGKLQLKTINLIF